MSENDILNLVTKARVYIETATNASGRITPRQYNQMNILLNHICRTENSLKRDLQLSEES